jgi:hypothetical protein
MFSLEFPKKIQFIFFHLFEAESEALASAVRLLTAVINTAVS